MQMRNVVATVQIVINEDFPVAMNVVRARFEIMQLGNFERRNPSYEAAEKILERRCLRIEIDENKFLPSISLDRHKPVLLTLEVLHTLEFWHSFQWAIESVIPAVIGTMQN